MHFGCDLVCNCDQYIREHINIVESYKKSRKMVRARNERVNKDGSVIYKAEICHRRFDDRQRFYQLLVNVDPDFYFHSDSDGEYMDFEELKQRWYELR